MGLLSVINLSQIGILWVNLPLTFQTNVSHILYPSFCMSNRTGISTSSISASSYPSKGLIGVKTLERFEAVDIITFGVYVDSDYASCSLRV